MAFFLAMNDAVRTISPRRSRQRGATRVMMVPVQLTNSADPTQRNGANGKDWPVNLKLDTNNFDVSSVAWIAAQDTNQAQVAPGVYPPRMPHLVASAGNIPGLTYNWKLQVTFYDRYGNPHRDFDTDDPNCSNTSPYLLINPMINTTYTATTPDQVTIPAPSGSLDSNPVAVNGWVQITNGSSWDIGIDPDWTNATNQGFFGGVAKLSLMITSSGGSVTNLPQQDYYFRIAGENPNATNCQAYIVRDYGGPNPPTRDNNKPNAWQGF